MEGASLTSSSVLARTPPIEARRVTRCVPPYVCAVTVESTVPVAVPSLVIVPNLEFWGLG